ncbi:MAG: sigma-54-dependent Fis family transcriptional regulator [Nitrospirae bacterium]|nr:MAG: sigma-54-dependent Fis family transcriptional regulator [Nitrospirota bacterium]
MKNGIPFILVVDDDPIVRTSCRKILGEEDYRIEEAASIREGRDVFSRGGFDLVLTDLKLPDGTGIELLRHFKEESPDTEVILITGYGTVSTAVQAMKYGAYDYVEKPFRPDELVLLVKRALEKRSLRVENRKLREAVGGGRHIKNIVSVSPAMEGIFRLIEAVSPTNSTVIVTGESGTGKELVARAIHFNSPRRDAPFVVVDCGSIPGELLESELFGYKKGAFTGAVSSRKGLIEEADGGTLFLDEIGNLPLHLQAKLLRVLQEREVRPLGDDRSVKVDIRVIAATNSDLKKMVKDGMFREDLYYRINIFPIHIPPLRERKEDVPVLADHFLRKYSQDLGKDKEGFTVEAMNILIHHEWSGNVRELENAVQRAILLSEGSRIGPEDLAFLSTDGEFGIPKDIEELKSLKRKIREKSVAEIERRFVLNALRNNQWNVTRAAEAVGMLRPNFHALMKKHNITRKT